MTQGANAIEYDNPSFSLNLKFTSRLNRSVAAPLWALTRIGGRRHCLRAWETRGDAFFLTMWNGDQHEITKNSCEAR